MGEHPSVVKALLKKAQNDIRQILINLEEQAGYEIEGVDVDTREFSNFATVIELEGFTPD
jgi:hypothetical protein